MLAAERALGGAIILTKCRFAEAVAAPHHQPNLFRQLRKQWASGQFLARGCLWKLTFRLEQTQLAGTCDRFGAPLNLEFAKDFLIVPLHCVQGEEQSLANLTIRETLANQMEDF
jgi:hypothetical protein